MKKIMEKSIIDKYIKEDMPKNIREVSIDLINYLSKKGFNAIKYINKVNRTHFILFDSKNDPNKKLEYFVEGRKVTSNLDWSSYDGFYVPIIVQNSKLKVELIEEICAFDIASSIPVTNEMYRQKIIHELLHLFSASLIIRDIGEDTIYNCGIEEIKYIYTKENKIRTQRINGMELVNEAITETLANEIYKQMYDPNFFMVSERKDGYEYPYINQYYLTSGFMRILNLFGNLTTKTDSLLYAYLNNDINYYLNNFAVNLETELEYIGGIIYVLDDYMSDYTGVYTSSFKKGFKEDILPIICDLIDNLYISLSVAKIDKKKKKRFVENAVGYLNYFFEYPIFNIISKEVISYANILKDI